VEDAFRGRVLSIYMTQWSLFLIGAFLFGVMAEIIGVKIVFALCSLLTLGISFVIILFFPLMRKID
jgi:hypothetical protein